MYFHSAEKWVVISETITSLHTFISLKRDIIGELRMFSNTQLSRSVFSYFGIRAGKHASRSASLLVSKYDRVIITLKFSISSLIIVFTQVTLSFILNLSIFISLWVRSQAFWLTLLGCGNRSSRSFNYLLRISWIIYFAELYRPWAVTIDLGYLLGFNAHCFLSFPLNQIWIVG
jgi:hypothetical protein